LDTHYSFVEYSGANIVHWSFLDKCSGIDVDRLCGKLFLVSDRDKVGTYKDELLGNYIETVLLKGKKKRRGKYADASGTITQKYHFWEMAIAEITSFSDLSGEIKAVVKKMSDFIEKNNPV
jgi:hypothetical protein